MTDLTYHVESENRSGKNYLSVSIVPASKQTKQSLLSLAKTSGEKSGLEFLLKRTGSF